MPDNKDRAHKLIEKYIDLIDTNKFEDFYLTIGSEVDNDESAVTGYISEILESVQIFPLDHLSYIPKYYAAYRQDLSTIVIPSHITAIDPGAFKFCSNLKEVILPEGLEVLDYQAFAACIRLEKINFPSTLVKIDREVFFNCASLDNYKLNNGLKEIDRRAFWGTKQDRVEMPASVTMAAPDVWGTKKIHFLIHRGAPLLPTYANNNFEYID